MRHNLKKLPEWARSLIQKLRSDVEHYRKESQTVVQQTSRIRAHHAEFPIFIPERVIRFEVKGGYVDVKLAGDGIEVRGSESFTINPHVSNVLSIHLTGRPVE